MQVLHSQSTAITCAFFWCIAFKDAALQCVISMMLCAMDVSAAGILMACKDLLFLARAMTVSLAVLVGYFSVEDGS